MNPIINAEVTRQRLEELAGHSRRRTHPTGERTTWIRRAPHDEVR